MIEKSVILDDNQTIKAITRISHEIIERNKDYSSIVLIGIVTRGYPMANLIKDKIEEITGVAINVGKIDITLYRDDLSELSEMPLVGKTSIDFDIKNKDVILVDDVIFTGRTARAAIEAILKIARPKTIQLAVLVDRGHRELPIKPDYVGKNIPTSLDEVVSVKFLETDAITKVSLMGL